MHGLSAQKLLHAWEVALGQHPVDRVLTILAAALPGISRDQLLTLSIGQRDTCLLAIREATFGSRFACFAECPACQERLEFVFEAADIRVTPGDGDTIDWAATNQLYEETFEGYELRFRLPNSLDLAQIARCRDVTTARNLLVERCLADASQHGVKVTATALPETMGVFLAERMNHYDSQAEVQLALSCPTCGHNWSVLFDIVSFFWKEICVQARRLLREVHMLARAYGWRESDILSMSTVRRQLYLEMVT